MMFDCIHFFTALSKHNYIGPIDYLNHRMIAYRHIQSMAFTIDTSYVFNISFNIVGGNMKEGINKETNYIINNFFNSSERVL